VARKAKSLPRISEVNGTKDPLGRAEPYRAPTSNATVVMGFRHVRQNNC
jgi:hypothetical protein